MTDYLDFERPLAELDQRINHLKEHSRHDAKAADEIKRLQKKAYQLQQELYHRLTPWQRTLLARHQDRPGMTDYIAGLLKDFTELHGDRLYGDDPAIMGGSGWLDHRPVMVIGHHKGKSVKERVQRNFGMPHPEGYRKALRLMQLAERFRRPLLTFIDTPGAYPGVGAEERGQSEAIARNLLIMSQLRIPILCVVMGEGGSGGALALGVGDRVLMLEHAVYSVISPEGCAAILWNDSAKAKEAAEAMKMTAPDLLRLGVIDEIISEPLGGAHRDPAKAIDTVKRVLTHHLEKLEEQSVDELLEQRYRKFRRMGVFLENSER
ncbi:MAG: acetyl-CoA carboxylase carboxyltransferase subunit alpha [Nitrospirota bacterium]